MVHIDYTTFGSITVNGKIYGQVLIGGKTVIERDEAKLNQLFSTTHGIGNWEVDILLSQSPNLIIIGTGTSGVLKVSDDVKGKINKAGIELKILLTPQAVCEFNKEIKSGRRVNALIHTTC